MLDYTASGLNQYTGTDEAPPLAAGETVPNPETVIATSYSYDANASLTSTGRWNYAYDAENRLMEAHDTVAGSVVFDGSLCSRVYYASLREQYDARGRRISKLVDQNLGGSFVADITYQYLYERAGPWCLWHRVSPRSPKRSVGTSRYRII